MTTNFELVRNWMQRMGQEVRGGADLYVTLYQKRLRLSLVREECDELLIALEQNDLIGIADGIADLLVVTYGTAVTYGIDADAVFREVMRSNDTKKPDNKRGDGKVMKDNDYDPPDIARVIGVAR